MSSINRFLKKTEDIEDQKNDIETPHEEGGHDESNWLISYADMMTLLCGFFVMMFSMATLDKQKFVPIGKEVSAFFGGGKVPATDPTEGVGATQDAVSAPNIGTEAKEAEKLTLMEATEVQTPVDPAAVAAEVIQKETHETADFFTNIVQQLGVEKDVVIESDASGVAIIFHSTLFFDTLSANLKEDARNLLNKIVESIEQRQRQVSKQYKIVVEGHTDSRPVIGGIYPSNWELSAARASRVVRNFVDRGFGVSNLLAIGYADSRPLHPNRLESGSWNETSLQKNRRVVIRVLDPTTNTIPWDRSTNSNTTSGEVSGKAVPVDTGPNAKAQ